MASLMLLTDAGNELGRVEGWEAGRKAAQRLADERGESVTLAAEGKGEEAGEEEEFEPRTLRDYATGAVLAGRIGAELIRESLAAEPTGAVPAYQDDSGVWEYVEPAILALGAEFAAERLAQVGCTAVAADSETAGGAVGLWSGGVAAARQLERDLCAAGWRASWTRDEEGAIWLWLAPAE